MTDKKFEELLKEAVEQCVEKEWEEISQKSKKIRYKPSKEFEEKMEKLYPADITDVKLTATLYCTQK